MEKTIPKILREAVRAYPDQTALMAKDETGSFQSLSYRVHWDQVLVFSSGLADMGVKRGDRVGIISDNRGEWALADRALLCLGAADVPRGCDTTEREIAYILSFAECRVSFAENRRQLDKMIASRAALPLLKDVVLMDEPSAADRQAASEAGFALSSMEELMERGRRFRAANPSYVEREVDLGSPSETATVIFTSGTTGEPKGVVLSHDNVVCQLEALPLVIKFKPGQTWLTILPIWHSYNRLLEYVAMSQAHAIAYSKPVASIMLPDLAAVKPQWLGSVPRIWEALMEGVIKSVRQSGGLKARLFFFFLSIGRARAFCRNLFLGLQPAFGPNLRILEVAASALPLLLLTPLFALGDALVFRKIKAKLGGNFLAGVSGGGALSSRVDRFFQSVGVLLLEGYGLTETAPVVAVRLQRHPVAGTVGPALSGAEFKIIGEDGKALGRGRRGVIHVRGRQVMQGYLKRPELTAAVLGPDGWLDTGDIGMLSRRGELRITGRAKDTIVLSGGENVEPAPIEAKLCESPYVLQACLVGQDMKYLGALIVPKEEAVSAFAKENGIMAADYESLLAQPEIAELFEDEVTGLVSPRNGFKIFERVVRFALLPKPFEAGRELSHKLDLARHKVADIHAKAIAGIFSERK